MFSEDFHFIWEILGLPILNSIPQLPSVKTLFVSSWKDDPTKCTRVNIRRDTESRIFLTSQNRRLRLLWFSMPSFLEGLLWRRSMIFMMNAVLGSWVQRLRLSHLASQENFIFLFLGPMLRSRVYCFYVWQIDLQRTVAHYWKQALLRKIIYGGRILPL